MIKEISKLLSPTLILNSKIQTKIQELCGIIHYNEWSGILFYKVKGVIGKKGAIIEAIDLFLMDEGSGVFTSFEASPEVATYMVENPELMEDGVYQAIIHSHNNMEAFLSGTDMTTLKDFGNDQVHCLSVVVNNRGDVVAKITYKVFIAPPAHTCVISTFNNKEVTKWREKFDSYYVTEVLDVKTSPIPMHQNPLLSRIIHIRNAKKVLSTPDINTKQGSKNTSIPEFKSVKYEDWCSDITRYYHTGCANNDYDINPVKPVKPSIKGTLLEDKIMAMFTNGSVRECDTVDLEGAEKLYSKNSYGFWAGVALLNFLISNEFLELLCSEHNIKDVDGFLDRVWSRVQSYTKDDTKYPVLNAIVEYVYGMN